MPIHCSEATSTQTGLERITHTELHSPLQVRTKPNTLTQGLNRLPYRSHFKGKVLVILFKI